MTRTADSYLAVDEADPHTVWHPEGGPGTLGIVDCQRVAGGLGGVSGHAPRGLKFLHLTTMYYDSESAENSSASASDYDDELNYEDGNREYNSDNNDAQSNVSYGENLRVRGLLSLPMVLYLTTARRLG